MNLLWKKTVTATECYLKGVSDSIQWHTAFPVIMQHKQLRTLATKCVVLNGLLFIGSLVLFKYVMHPLLLFMLGFLTNPLDRNQQLINEMFASYLLNFTYMVCYLYPIYVLSFILNSMWYQEIADIAFQLLDG